MTMTAGELFIDVSRLVGRQAKGLLPTGIDRVCLAYVARYQGQVRAVVRTGALSHVFTARRSQILLAWLLAWEGGDGRSSGRWPPHRAFLLAFVALLLRDWWSWRWPARTRDRLYLNVGHTGLQSPAYRRFLDRTGLRPVYMVHDLIPIRWPEHCRAGEDRHHAVRMRTVLETAAGIIANSRATLEDLQDFADRAGLRERLDATHQLVVHLAAPALPAVPAPAVPALGGRPYFVVLGTIESRKNHLLLLRVWRRLCSDLGDCAPVLVIIGRRGWRCEAALDLLDHCESLRPAVMEVPRCTDAELAAWLRHARALLFPSWAEGFGLPLAEALGLGTPAIVSDLPTLREYAGGIPLYLPPDDESAWQAAVLDYAVDDSAARRSQIERLACYVPPDWPTHFRAVDDLLGHIRLRATVSGPGVLQEQAA